ncbi:MAG: isopentenyl phosphate kinase [Candidatus Micrarchaeaceae archaeon]
MPLYFVKIGGSIITDTSKPSTPKIQVIEQLVKEIKEGAEGKSLVIGHGSGSFGHVAVHQYHLENGLEGNGSAYNAAMAHSITHELHYLLIKAMLKYNLPVLSFLPSASAYASNGKIINFNVEPIKKAIESGFVPLVGGDILIDREKGVHIASTEEVFSFLAAELKPSKVIVAGDIDGIFDSDPKLNPNAKLISKIDSTNIESALKGAGPSLKIDVTGGARTKLEFLYNISKNYGSSCYAINGTVPGRLRDAIIGTDVVGTEIKA